MVKNLPASSGEAGDSGSLSGWGRSPGEGMATRSNIFSWKIPWTEEPGWVTIQGVAKSWTQLIDRLCTHTHTHTNKNVGRI